MSVFSQVDQMIKLGGKDVEDTAVYYGTCAINHSAEKNQLCKDTEDRIINLYGDAEGSGLRKALNLDVDHKEDQRKVTTYTALNKSADLQTEKALHQIKDLKTSGYYLVSRISGENTEATSQQVDMILRKPGIYYVDETDLETIQAKYDEIQKKYDSKLAVELEPLQNFFNAEEYHQKYLDKNPGAYCHIPASKFKKGL